jgi:CRP-like cAMP-binding protein
MLERRHFKAGEALIRENELGESAYIIEKGRVEITKELGGQPVRLAVLGPGETVGEMSMIADKPRSATAVALEKTEAREIHQDDFYEALQTDPKVTLVLLRNLFERLREADATILQLRAATSDGSEAPAGEQPERGGPVVVLEGATTEAREALADGPCRIDRFPFRIGRLSHNPLVHNDLTIEDDTPWQVSRHHLAFVLLDGRVAVADRGSTLGSSVDGRRLGGERGDPGPLTFSGDRGSLVLGNEKSPFRFDVTIQSE